MNLSEVLQKTMIRSSRSSTSHLLYKLCTYPKLLAPQPPCSSPTTTSAGAVLSHLRRFFSASRKFETPSMRNLINIGNFGLLRGESSTQTIVSFRSPFQVARFDGSTTPVPCFARAFSSKSNSKGQKTSESKKEISTVEDPFDAPTYNIPDKPLSFTEGASYSVAILAGLGIAAAAGYAVFKELILEPKEYKVFGKALRRIQDDSQVRVRIGSPITGYGQESRNRAARQRIPNRVWKDDDGAEHVEVNFYIRGPHGAGKVFAEMFKDQVDRQWKFVYLQVEINSPSPSRLLLESYLPA